ncbi:MAG: hypothetical protein ACM34J_03455, partial [Ignavibacteria bacterium]
MKDIADTEYLTIDVIQIKEFGKPAPYNEVLERAFKELECKVEMVLETYSNVHRGTGHFSLITTELFER